MNNVMVLNVLWVNSGRLNAYVSKWVFAYVLLSGVPLAVVTVQVER